MRPGPTPLVLLWTAAAACGSTPSIAVPEAPDAALDVAEVALADGRPEEAHQVLRRLDRDELVGRERERFDWLHAAALHGTGRSWAGFEAIRDFPEVHRFSEFAPGVERLHFDIGRTLIESDGGFWIFQSDEHDGEKVLQEFLERDPTNVSVPDALALLGQLAWEEERWTDARRRYERIVTEHPSSEWVRLARFRIAMSRFAELEGPQYDLGAMYRAREELGDFLATTPERPEFLDASQEALQIVEDWIADRFLVNARFYRTIDNLPGEIYHLEQLVVAFPDSPQAALARERLAELGEGGP